MALMSKLTAAYMAGFIDGEGSLMLMPHKNKKYPDRPYYTSVLKIASTDKSIMDRIYKSFGGSMYMRTPYKENHKPSYCWQTSCKKLEPILEAIRPYLVIKKKQCELLMEKQHYHKRYAGNQIPEEIGVRFKEIYNELRVLNKRGVNIGSVND